MASLRHLLLAAVLILSVATIHVSASQARRFTASGDPDADAHKLVHRIGVNPHLIDVDNFVFRFEVRAASDAFLLFTALGHEADRAKDSWKIMLGARGNSVSSISRGFTGKPLVQVDTPNILSADESRAFWITVTDDTEFVPTATQQWRFIITVGSGDVVGEHVIMRAHADWLGQDFLMTAYGAWDTPATYSNVRYDKADLVGTSRDDLVDWFGEEYADYLLDKWESHLSTHSSEHAAKLAAEAEQKKRWRDSTNTHHDEPEEEQKEEVAKEN